MPSDDTPRVRRDCARGCEGAGSTCSSRLGGVGRGAARGAAGCGTARRVRVICETGADLGVLLANNSYSAVCGPRLWEAAVPGLSNSAPRRGLWAGPTPRRAVEKPCGGSSRRSCRECHMGQFCRSTGEKVSYMACSRLLLGGGRANALPRGRVRGRAPGKGWAKTRQRLRREAKNSLSWGPATWIMITTMRMTPLMVSWMSESILRAMMILSMTS